MASIAGQIKYECKLYIIMDKYKFSIEGQINHKFSIFKFTVKIRVEWKLYIVKDEFTIKIIVPVKWGFFYFICNAIFLGKFCSF